MVGGCTPPLPTGTPIPSFHVLLINKMKENCEIMIRLHSTINHNPWACAPPPVHNTTLINEYFAPKALLIHIYKHGMIICKDKTPLIVTMNTSLETDN